jgi:23S rRNA (uracil1939-C5)-methyltransferase
METNETKSAARPKVGARFKARVDGLAFGGAGVARLEGGLVVFVRGAVPGDEVEAIVTKRRRGYLEARASEIVSPSPDRIRPRCEQFEFCGGCKWQNYVYEKQLDWKERQVRDHLERIGGICNPPVERILGMDDPWKYRNKMEYTFSEFKDSRLKLGLHAEGSFDRIIELDRCWLQNEKCNEVRNHVRDFFRARGTHAHNMRSHEGLLRHLVLRSAGADIMACIVTHTAPEFELLKRDFAESVASCLPDVKSLLWHVNPGMSGVAIAGECELLAGSPTITDSVLGLKMTISADSFAQTNPSQCARLYGLLLESAELNGEETVYDLYTGAAPIAMLLSRRARRVIAIESNPSAVADGRANLAANGIGNVELVEGEVEKTLAAKCESAPPDVVSVDPPRIGLHKHALRALIAARPRQVLYVSCNPSTLARDAADLVAAGYTLSRVQPVDMFPHTSHVECVARFDLAQPRI